MSKKASRKTIQIAYLGGVIYLCIAVSYYWVAAILDNSSASFLLWYPLFCLLAAFLSTGAAGNPWMLAPVLMVALIAQLVHTGLLARRTQTLPVLTVAVAAMIGLLSLVSASMGFLLIFQTAK